MTEDKEFGKEADFVDDEASTLLRGKHLDIAKVVKKGAILLQRVLFLEFGRRSVLDVLSGFYATKVVGTLRCNIRGRHLAIITIAIAATPARPMQLEPLFSRCHNILLPAYFI